MDQTEEQKAQDKLSRRAAVEKQPWTLEKDKEGKSKYYFSYPKLPVLLRMIIQETSYWKLKTTDVKSLKY